MGTVYDFDGREVDFDAAMHTADRDICEELNRDSEYCSEQEYFEAYARRHAEVFDGEEFAPYYGGAW